MYKYFLLPLLFIFTSCASNKNSDFEAKDIVQTNGAIQIRKYLNDIDKLLLEYQVKLNKRNPSQSDKEFAQIIKNEIENQKDRIKITNLLSQDYTEYIEKAFQKDVKRVNRNEYLILGIYKLIYDAYNRDEKNNFTALSYDIEKMEKANEALQVIFWRVKSYRNIKDEYLYLTWQKNWQVELENRLRKGEKFSSELIENLSYIKENKETLFEASNQSFAQIEAKILYIIDKTLRLKGSEAAVLSTDALKAIILLPF